MIPPRPTLPDRQFVELQSALAGRYSLERELGRGGMGIVYLAREVRLERAVAIKLLPPELASRPEVRHLLLEEARTAAQLTHPNIVPVFTVEELGGLVFFAMAYIPGETLGGLIHRRGPLPPSQAARTLREIAWALAYAHRCGVIHRDLKPDNVLLEEGSGRALLSDFGIARRASGNAALAVGGTRGFMSPEQARGEPGDARSDVYAFGVTAWFTLTGRMPEPGGQALPAGIPSGLAGLIRRCLATDPRHRPEHGDELVSALSGHADAAPSLPPVLRRWLTRATPFRRIFTAWSVFFGFVTMANSVLPTFTTVDLLYWLGLTFAPWLLIPPMRLLETQRALAAGYSLEDLRTALRITLEQRREELLADFQQDQEALPGVRRKVLRAILLLAAGLVFTIFVVLRTGSERAGLYGWAPLFLTVSVVLLLIALALRRRSAPPRDLGSELRYRLWRGWLGGWLAKLAGYGIKRPAQPAMFSQRPTEVVLGQAARGLFEALPAEQRRVLAGYPDVIQRLEGDASRLRRLVEQLGAAGDGGALAQVRDRHQEVIASLEALRLGLLRLQTGTGSLAGVTTDLRAAEELAQGVDRIVAAQKEVKDLLDG